MLNTNRMIQLSANAVALTLFAAAIGCGRGQNPSAQLALLVGALPISLVGSYHGALADKTEPYARMRDAASLEMYAGQLAAAIEIPVMPAPMLPAPMMPAASAPMGEGMSEAIAFYDWQQLPDDASGIIVTGNAGSGKSSLALWLLGLLTQNQPAIIKVLDPHKALNNWHEHGLEVVGDFDQIESELAGAVGELDRRRTLARSELEKLPGYIFVADELMAMLSEFSDPKAVNKALSRLGCEGRKYGVSLIAIAHSANTEALGIDAKLRSNYLVIAIGASARQIGEKVWGKKSSEYSHLNAVAYPCLVGGSIPDQVAIHPTHGTYSQYKKKGNAPRNLLPINQVNKPHQNISNSPKSEGDVIKSYLDRLYDLPDYAVDTTDSLSECQIYPNSPGSSPDVTQSERGLQASSESQSESPSQVAKEGFPASILDSRSLHSMIISLRNEGQKQEQIIKLLWGLSKSGRENYKQAVAEFKRITDEN